MHDPGRYAHPELERRFLLDELPSDAHDPRRIDDRYLTGTRLRLRVITDPASGEVLARKLGHKIRPQPDDPTTIWHTTMYLDTDEAATLAQLNAVTVTKTRYRWTHDSHPAAVDVYDHPPRLVVAELNFSDYDTLSAYQPTPPLRAEITHVAALTGPNLTRHSPEA